MIARTSEEARNEQVIRTLYSLAEGKSKNTSRFVSLFTDDGYFYDVGAGKKYFGSEIGVTVDVYAAAFPDMNRDLYALRSFGDHVLVELSLNGTHKGDLVIPAGTISPTGKQMHAPCCDVFHLKDGKVFSFHCYVWPYSFGATRSLHESPSGPQTLIGTVSDVARRSASRWSPRSQVLPDLSQFDPRKTAVSRGRQPPRGASGGAR
jgi:ketosteroid isomerase-like protein